MKTEQLTEQSIFSHAILRIDPADLQKRQYLEDGAYHRTLANRILAGFRYEIALKLIPEDLREGINLDFGGGDGMMTTILKQNGMESVVYDIDRYAINLGKRDDTSIQGIQGNSFLPFPSATFTTSTMLETLEHVEDDNQVLGEINRILIPGGALVVSVPSDNMVVPAKHYRHYSEGELYEILEDNNFNVKRVIGWKTPENLLSRIKYLRKIGTASALAVDILTRNLVKDSLGTRVCSSDEAQGFFVLGLKNQNYNLEI